MCRDSSRSGLSPAAVAIGVVAVAGLAAVLPRVIAALTVVLHITAAVVGVALVGAAVYLVVQLRREVTARRQWDRYVVACRITTQPALAAPPPIRATAQRMDTTQSALPAPQPRGTAQWPDREPMTLGGGR